MTRWDRKGSIVAMQASKLLAAMSFSIGIVRPYLSFPKKPYSSYFRLFCIVYARRGFRHGCLPVWSIPTFLIAWKYHLTHFHTPYIHTYINWPINENTLPRSSPVNTHPPHPSLSVQAKPSIPTYAHENRNINQTNVSRQQGLSFILILYSPRLATRGILMMTSNASGQPTSGLPIIPAIEKSWRSWWAWCGVAGWMLSDRLLGLPWNHHRDQYQY